jgi:hypothetical protein
MDTGEEPVDVTRKEPLGFPTTPPAPARIWVPRGPSVMVAPVEINKVTGIVALPPELTTVSEL